MVVKRLQGSKRDGKRVEKPNQIKRVFMNFLEVVITADVLMETGNEFLKLKMPSNRSL